MDQTQYEDLAFCLVDKLGGKMSLLQPQKERELAVEEALTGVLANGAFAHLKPELDNPEQRLQFIRDFLSYGIITELLCDFCVEDLIVNNLNPIYIHHSQKGFISTGKHFSTHRELDLFIRKILLFCGRKSMDKNKIVNLELPNLEGRVNIVLSPFGPQMTITKAKVSPLSILDLAREGTLTHEVAAQLWMYIEGMSIRPANIMIAGGPGVGQDDAFKRPVRVYPGDRPSGCHRGHSGIEYIPGRKLFAPGKR